MEYFLIGDLEERRVVTAAARHFIICRDIDNVLRNARRQQTKMMDLSITGMQQYGTAYIEEISPKKLCQSFFFIAASAVMFLYSIPAFRQRFISYGSRISSQPPPAETLKDKKASNEGGNRAATNIFSRLLDYISTFQVPHSWFTHFYVISVFSSIFWAIQIITRGRFFDILASRQVAYDDEKQRSTLSTNQIFIAWSFMAIQGTRRLYESIIFGKASKSKMWVVHWILGLLYYSATGIAIWIEGSSKS